MNFRFVFMIAWGACFFLCTCKRNEEVLHLGTKQVYLTDTVPKPSYVNFVDSITGNYLVSGSYSYWSAPYPNLDTTYAVASDTLFVSKVNDSTIHVNGVYDSVYHIYAINVDLPHSSTSSSAGYSCFETYWMDDHWRLSFSRLHVDSVYAYTRTGGLSAAGGYNLSGIRMH